MGSSGLWALPRRVFSRPAAALLPRRRTLPNSLAAAKGLWWAGRGAHGCSYDLLGHLLENIVYLELRRRRAAVTYHMTDAGHEVDFVVRRRGAAVALIQVCATLADAETRRRELRALEEGLRELEVPAATVITMGEEATLRLAGRPVRVVPAWRWLLEP